MEMVTRNLLMRLTDEFYRAYAGDFSNSRSRPWESWPRIFDIAETQTAIDSVLDIGCGNGRLINFLEPRLSTFDYIGTDTSEELIDIARQHFPQRRFIHQSVEETVDERYTSSLVAAFGLMHHLPGHNFRQAIIKGLSGHLQPGGVLVLSFWMPESLVRFDNKRADLQLEGLESGDHLLGWNGQFTHLRYCHSFTSDEIDDLINGLNLLDRFQGTGNDKTNHYVVLTNR